MMTEPATPAADEPVCVCGHPVRLHHEDVCLLAGCSCADCLELGALPDCFKVVLTERFTELGNPFSRMRINFQGPDGWPASRDVSPNDVAEALRELLRRAADEVQPDTSSAASSPCSVPDPCQDGELRDRHETEHAHAAGHHGYCGVTCEVEFPTEMLRNGILAKGYPGTAGMLDELLRRAASPAERLRAERDELTKRVAELDRSETQLIGERDHLHDVADQLAYAIAPIEVIGEHSSENDPWQNALEHVTPAAQVNEQKQRVAEVLRIVSDWCVEANDVGGVDAGDLAWRLEQAGHQLPDEETAAPAEGSDH